MSSWIQKLDTYFQLNPMAEKNSIKLEALHIDEEANYWWFHGMKSLGHDQVVTYEEFTRRLAEMFDQRYPDISFHELSHIKQLGTPQSYILEIQKVALMVTDVSEARMILLFTEGLAEPLKGLVKLAGPQLCKK